MEIVLIILGFTLLVVGVFGALVPILPGPPLSFMGLLILQLGGRAGFSAAFLWTWAIITLAVTIMDNILPAIMTKKFGGSRLASIGSLLGLVIGAIFFPPLGIIAGAFLGAFTGEFINSRANSARAFRAALGAFFAFIVGSGAKLITSSLMLFYAIRAGF